MRTRRPTTTQAFGTGKRESHDASGFYGRFTPPVLSDDDVVAAPTDLGELLVHGDARNMTALPDASVALVVTSPPYFAGKAYEEALGVDGVPADYLEYLDMLRSVFAECVRVLEPGGRIAVNVANLGRKPYRSLAADVIGILQDDLGLLLRGEVVWAKAEGAGGSCAWGSFRSAANPVLRDLTERVVIASKGKFDRARTPDQRRGEGLPSQSAITNDEFLEATLDLWRIAPESARRVGHPAPFPVELPLRLIDLYTYEGDLVLDPFLGSGSTAVAAARRGRRWAGYDTDADYVALARQRVVEELERAPADDEAAFTAAVEEGKGAVALAEVVLERAGFGIVDRGRAVGGVGLKLLVAADAEGTEWLFDVTGAFTTQAAGLARTDAVWKAVGRAAVVKAQGMGPLVLLTSHLPPPRSAAGRALRSLGPIAVHDAIAMLDPEGTDRLARYAKGGEHLLPLPGFWERKDLG